MARSVPFPALRFRVRRLRLFCLFRRSKKLHGGSLGSLWPCLTSQVTTSAWRASRKHKSFPGLLQVGPRTDLPGEPRSTHRSPDSLGCLLSPFTCLTGGKPGTAAVWRVFRLRHSTLQFHSSLDFHKSGELQFHNDLLYSFHSSLDFHKVWRASVLQLPTLQFPTALWTFTKSGELPFYNSQLYSFHSSPDFHKVWRASVSQRLTLQCFRLSGL